MLLAHCTFSNALVGTQYQFTSHQGTGIHSLNSSFVVKNDCSVLTQVGEPCPLESTTISNFANLHRVIERLTHGPRKVLSLPVVHIVKGALADITLFDPEVNWTCGEADLVSRSHNTPFPGQRFTGRPWGILANGQVVLAPAFEGAVPMA